MSRSSTSSTRSDLRLDIIRDPGFCGDWMNCYCENADTHESLYYCDVASDDHQLEIHRGNKYGPVIAKTSRCMSNPGATDMVARGGSAKHIHYDENRASSYFSAGGQNYRWNSNMELLNDSGAVVAQMSLVRDTQARRSGELLIKEDAVALADPIVMSALLVQERLEEQNACF